MQSQAVNPLSARRSSQRRGRPAATKRWRSASPSAFPICHVSCSALRGSRSMRRKNSPSGTAAQLAKQIGVQPSALVRFAGAIGCDGFAEMRQLSDAVACADA